MLQNWPVRNLSGDSTDRKNHSPLWALRVRRGLACLTVLSLLSANSLAAVKDPFETVVTERVNLRQSPSTRGQIIRRVNKDTAIVVIGESGNFFQVRVGDQEGYIAKEFVVTDEDRITLVTPRPEDVAYGFPYQAVTLAKATLRAHRTRTAQALAEIPKGSTVQVVNHMDGSTYVKVSYDNQEGFILKSAIRLKEVRKPTPSPGVVATPAPDVGTGNYTIVRQGDTGEVVGAVQAALVELGFLTGTPDGKFGTGTAAAVKAFQAANGYPANGELDQNIQAFLFSGKPKNVKGEKTAVSVVAPLPGVTIVLNNTGELVGKVQARLKELGYYTGAVSQVYDKDTRKAVLAFQRKNNLKTDGRCTEETRALLFGTGLGANQAPTPVPTAEPTPAPTFLVPGEAVRIGDSGASARMVQQRLIDLGYMSGKADGKFGKDSVSALKAFQANNGLKADGAAGEATYRVLFSYMAKGAHQGPALENVITPTPAPLATPVLTKDSAVKIKLGVAGDAVRALQERLTALGYYSSVMDGVAKADDVAAIKAFQQKNGLTADGVAGYETQSALYSPTAVGYQGAIAGGTVDVFPLLKRGSASPLVTKLQNRLIELGYLTGTADGNYGADTQKAIRAFQKNNGMVQDGKAGNETQARLYSANAVGVAANPAGEETPASPLARGDKSDQVKLMQQRLIDLGYLSGVADGNFGLQTYLALQTFQRNNSLSTDGIAGGKTMAVLQSSRAVDSKGQIPAPTRAPGPSIATNVQPSAGQVRYENWYTAVRNHARKYPYVTVYDYSTGISWQIHIFSVGSHADGEPLTANDTAKMERAFGGNTWNPKPVWVIFGDGSIYMGSTHSVPHGVQHNQDNGFSGHTCIHFPRTSEQVASIGPYATSHQRTIDAGWSATQSMAK